MFNLATKGRSSMKFIQITDTHVVERGRRLHELVPTDRLDACIADINKNHQDAKFCIITGDLVHQGKAEEYGELRRIVSNLELPFYLMIGNHDHRGNFVRFFPEVGRDENGFVQYVVPTSVGDFILLDTVEPDIDAGVLCPLRLAWLRARLDNSGSRSVFLFMHHPPFHIGIPSLDNICLKDPEPLADLIDQYSSIRHLFFGHVHRPVSGCWRGVPFSALRGTNHQVPLDFETTSHVPKCHEPPCYAVILLQEDLTVIHYHDYLNKSAFPCNAL